MQQAIASLECHQLWLLCIPKHAMDAPPSSSFFLDPTCNTYCPCSRPNQYRPSDVPSYALHALHALLFAPKFKPCVLPGARSGHPCRSRLFSGAPHPPHRPFSRPSSTAQVTGAGAVLAAILGFVRQEGHQRQEGQAGCCAAAAGPYSAGAACAEGWQCFQCHGAGALAGHLQVWTEMCACVRACARVCVAVCGSSKVDNGDLAGMHASWTSQLPLQLLLGPGPMQQALTASSMPSLRSI